MKNKANNELTALVVKQNLLIWIITKSFIDIDDQLKNLTEIPRMKTQ